MWRDGERKREKEGVWLWQSADYIHFARWPPASVFLPLPHTHTLSLWVSPGPWRGIVYSVCLAYIFSSFHLRCLNICGSTTLCFLSTSSSTGKISQIHNTSRCIQFMKDILEKKLPSFSKIFIPRSASLHPLQGVAYSSHPIFFVDSCIRISSSKNNFLSHNDVIRTSSEIGLPSYTEANPHCGLIQILRAQRNSMP